MECKIYPESYNQPFVFRAWAELPAQAKDGNSKEWTNYYNIGCCYWYREVQFFE